MESGKWKAESRAASVDGPGNPSPDLIPGNSIPLPRFHWFNVVDSTNNLAIEMAKQGEPAGMAVIARKQTSGRGRRGRVWHDEPGSSMLMSMIVTRELPVAEIPRLAFVVSLAVADSLRSSCGLDALLKWPNDIMSGDKKIGGILIETAGSSAVAGIGINVRQASFPPEINETATSLYIETGQEKIDIDVLAENVARSVLIENTRLISGGFEDILGRWRKYMWGIGRTVDVVTEANVISGVITGISADGALLINESSGATRTIYAADAINVRT